LNLVYAKLGISIIVIFLGVSVVLLPQVLIKTGSLGMNESSYVQKQTTFP